jgi:hypothetical protein
MKIAGVFVWGELCCGFQIPPGKRGIMALSRKSKQNETELDLSR